MKKTTRMFERVTESSFITKTNLGTERIPSFNDGSIIFLSLAFVLKSSSRVCLFILKLSFLQSRISVKMERRRVSEMMGLILGTSSSSFFGLIFGHVLHAMFQRFTLSIHHERIGEAHLVSYSLTLKVRNFMAWIQVKLV